MADRSDGLNSRLFGELGNKLNMAVSNRSLVAANQQLRIQLALAKTDNTRLQNEIVDLHKRIAELETASDEERIEMIVRKRLQQRVRHLKSIANRTIVYMNKATCDFESAAKRLDHVLTFDDDVIHAGECSQITSSPAEAEHVTSTHQAIQKSFALEAVEEDIFGEMTENQENGSNNEPFYDRRPIQPMSEDDFKHFFCSSTSARKYRNSRRQTFFIKKESEEFEDFLDTAVVEVSLPGTSQETPFMDEDSEKPDVAHSPLESETHVTPKISLAEYNRKKCAINRRGSKSAAVMRATNNRSLTGNTPKRRRSSGNNLDLRENVRILQNTPQFSLSNSFMSAVSGSSERPRRAAADKITSFKEPSLKRKMRNPNVTK